jgi:hypothetical protein
MRFSKRNIEEKLILYQLALKNALEDEEVTTLVAAYGYDTVKLNEGMALYTAADTLMREQKARYSDQYKATKEFNTLIMECRPTFDEHYGLARLALRDETSSYNMLGLKTPVKRTYAALIAQAKDFYHNALSYADVIAALAQFGITVEALQTAKLLITDVEAAYVAKQKTMTEAQMATRARNEAFGEIKEWMERFLGVCRFALNDAPELIEKVGILYRSSTFRPGSGDGDGEVETPQTPEPAPEPTPGT